MANALRRIDDRDTPGGDQGGGAHTPTAQLAYLAPEAGGRSGTQIVNIDEYETDGFIPEADIVYFDESAEVEASEGTVIVWANEETHFHGTINAPEGFVEVSGAQLIADGSVFVGSGELLIDPVNLCVFGGGGAGACGFALAKPRQTERVREGVKLGKREGTGQRVFTQQTRACVC